MTIIKDKEFQDLENNRYQLNYQLEEDLVAAKSNEQSTLKVERAGIVDQFKQNNELQNSLNEAGNLK